jgi:hypothetical protein
MAFSLLSHSSHGVGLAILSHFFLAESTFMYPSRFPEIEEKYKEIEGETESNDPFQNSFKSGPSVNQSIGIAEVLLTSGVFGCIQSDRKGNG